MSCAVVQGITKHADRMRRDGSIMDAENRLKWKSWNPFQAEGNVNTEQTNYALQFEL